MTLLNLEYLDTYTELYVKKEVLEEIHYLLKEDGLKEEINNLAYDTFDEPY